MEKTRETNRLRERLDTMLLHFLTSEFAPARRSQLFPGRLIHCLQVVRVPSYGRPKLIYDQAKKLYSEIERGVSVVHERKLKLRLLLNALDFQTFFQHALDHFCKTIESPFDFVQISFSKGRLSSAFSRNTLAIAVSMMNSPAKPRPSVIFEKLSYLIASCIMLDAVRHDIRGRQG
jgi:hypothetical protein